jgi:hypothetical protein
MAIPPVFPALSEEVLDQVPPLVGVAVKARRDAAVGFGRDDRLDPGLSQRVVQPVRIESPVPEISSKKQRVVILSKPRFQV